MKIKQTLENSSSYPHVNDVTSVVGTFVSSFVLVIVLIFGCVACRRQEKKGRDSNRQARNDQDENEYQIPDVNIPRDADKSPTGDEANIYTLPEPTVVYTDLDKLALKSGTVPRNQDSQPPTQYAIIDEEKLNAARKERQEKLYENVDSRNAEKPVIYQNANIT